MSGIIGKIINRIQMFVGQALLAAVKDDTAIQLIKLSGVDDENQDNIERLQNYGMTSNPPVKSETVVLYADGDRSAGLAIAIDSGEFRIRNLATGEVCFYSKHNQTILFNDAGETVFNSGSDFLAKFTELQKGFDQLVDDHNNHVHVTTATVSAGSAGILDAPTTSSTASIDASKITKLRA